MSRFLTLIFVLAMLPFAVVVLNKKMNPRRDVAADQIGYQDVDTSYDLSESSPEEFNKAFKYQVLRNVKIEKTSEGPQLKISSFLMRAPNGNKVSVCDLYPTVDYIFSAEGVAFSGEIPQLVVRTSCQVSGEERHIIGLPIPFQRILQSPLDLTELTVEATQNHGDGKVYFKNVVEFWPTEWAWTGVRFYPENTNELKELDINGYEIISVLGEPLILSE